MKPKFELRNCCFGITEYNHKTQTYKMTRYWFTGMLEVNRRYMKDVSINGSSFVEYNIGKDEYYKNLYKYFKANEKEFEKLLDNNNEQ